MLPSAPKSPRRVANDMNVVLNQVLGKDRFDHGPLDIEAWALEYSKQVSPEGPIHEVRGAHLPGCAGALVYGESLPRQWAIMFNQSQDRGRRAFTIAHELGHFALHRKMIEDGDEYKADHGILCEANSVERRSGGGIEKEADDFAANLLMPLDDFRKTLPVNERPNFDRLGEASQRYGVSLTSAILRWLECTQTRALLIVSNEGFAHWAKCSEEALKSGRFIRTKNETYELPADSVAIRRDFTDETRTGIQRPAGVWFPEPAIEMCLRSDKFDLEMTLLHFESGGPRLQLEEEGLDTFDRFEGRR